MYLRALEIQGFKSFPDKTVLNFGEDITAIVGPNGSGKSNISDAIRWVMGEQSVKGLRGAKMEDVIFGGTEKRSQVGFAQVTLVLDNTEHIFPTMEESEVSVTRRYYRSGESEYYINRQSVRLKDLTELFLDTGMGREGYSIIGQGKIDEILSAKSGERREIFEEAAGISKFRHRKEEAERKLERTEENLVRINDKIAELELQVEPLREQAEKARKYLVLRDELRLLEISVWLENLDTLKAAPGSWRRTFTPQSPSGTRPAPLWTPSMPRGSGTASGCGRRTWRLSVSGQSPPFWRSRSRRRSPPPPCWRAPSPTTGRTSSGRRRSWQRRRAVPAALRSRRRSRKPGWRRSTAGSGS